MADKLSFSDLVNKYASPDEKGIRSYIQKQLKENKVKLVILDDDPTGIQTVHGCLLLTNWKTETLEKAFIDKEPFFYLLTNSRSLNAKEAKAINKEVIEAVLKINQSYDYKLIFISRSDSTLRGHFPLEPDTIKEALAARSLMPKLPVFFIPCFFEAGRITYENTHYLDNGKQLVPVNQTEFANDNVFGYSHANLVEYIIEKSNSNLTEDQIGNLCITDLRAKSIDDIQSIISSLISKNFIIVNAITYIDLYRFAFAFLGKALQEKSPAILRTSSSLPKALSGIADKPILTKKELVTEQEKPGIYIVGSHVKKTTDQLNELLKQEEITGIEIDIPSIIKSKRTLLKRTIKTISGIWKGGKTPVIYTSREEVRLENKTKRLNLGLDISAFLVSIVVNLPARPAYIIAKGGITSNDILTKGLRISHARVSGQILPGVPVIQTSADHKYPLLPYIIFPGNVGDEFALATVFEKLK